MCQSGICERTCQKNGQAPPKSCKVNRFTVLTLGSASLPESDVDTPDIDTVKTDVDQESIDLAVMTEPLLKKCA